MSKQIDGHKPGRYEMVPVGELIPYVNNARTHSDGQIVKLQASIREFGFVNPVLIDGNKNIIAGHGRVEAAKREGIGEVPCVFVEHLTDTQRKAYILADNRLAEDAGWDVDILKLELDALADLDFDIALTGFDVSDMSAPNVSDDDFDADAVADAIAEPVTKLGDIWTLGRHRLMCGDSTDRATVDRLMGGAKADMVFTDPPYGIDIVGDNGKVGADNVAKNKVYSKVISDDTTETAEKAYNILKDICDRLIIWGGNYFTPFLEYSDGLLIWDKRCGMGSNNFADGEMAYCSFHTPLRIYRHLWSGMIQEGERENRVHPTQKPAKMVGDILKDFTEIDNVIVDVFGGSGSTLIACEQLNRTCYMMELDPKYCDVIINRWETLTGEKAVLING